MQGQDQAGFHRVDHTVLDGSYKTANGGGFVLRLTIRHEQVLVVVVVCLIFY